MKAAGIIAAGEGSRLRAAGEIKPLIQVAGRPLASWVVSGLQSAGVDQLTLLHNSRGRLIRESLKALHADLSWTFLQADTSSSWESFRLVCRTLSARNLSFLISTSDSLIAPEAVAEFARKMEASGASAGLALTTFVDDEKPLWAELKSGFVTNLGDSARKDAVTCGLYYMTSAVVEQMEPASQFSSLRSYLGSLVSKFKVASLVVPKSIDVDRPEDLAAAESFLISR